MGGSNAADVAEWQADDIAVNMLGLWKAGGTLGEALGLDRRECEALYGHGHALYGQGMYEDAHKIFAQLVSYDHLEPRYQVALASAMQMAGRYEEALQQYMVATVMLLDDPAPVYHSAECLLALGRPAEAIASLELVGALCRPGEHDGVKVRAQALIKALQDTAASIDAGGVKK